MKREDITPKQAKEWLENGEAILIDVREADEFKQEHIAYAQSIPLSQIHAFFEKLNLPKGKKLIFHCLKGMRGSKACDVVMANELPETAEVYNIDGGINAWKEAGFAIVKQSNAMPIFRQVQIAVGLVLLLLSILHLANIANTLVFIAVISLALIFAGLTGWCGLAMLLAKMPWNNK